MSEKPIYPVAVKPPSGISSWDGWPDDVRDTLWAWNHGYPKDSRLSFRWTSRRVFKCPDCDEFCVQPLAAELDDVLLCDDCLIARVRATQQQGDH